MCNAAPVQYNKLQCDRYTFSIEAGHSESTRAATVALFITATHFPRSCLVFKCNALPCRLLPRRRVTPLLTQTLLHKFNLPNNKQTVILQKHQLHNRG